MIGRSDVVFTAPASVSMADIIAGVCRQYWPAALFQDVDDEEAHPLDGDRNGAGSSREFFIYRDASAADAWEKLGAVAENKNTMLHFLIRDCGNSRSECEVTCVCDARTGDAEKIINSIQSELAQSTKT